MLNWTRRGVLRLLGGLLALLTAPLHGSFIPRKRKGSARLLTAEALEAAVSGRPFLDWPAYHAYALTYPQRCLSVCPASGAVAVIGRAANGRMAVLAGCYLSKAEGFKEMAETVTVLLRSFDCTHLAYDYCGSGPVFESYLPEPRHVRTLRMWYVTARGPLPLVQRVEAREPHWLEFYRVSRTWSLNATCALIRAGRLSFERTFSLLNATKPLVDEFLTLYEDRAQTETGEVLIISRDAGARDQFVHAVNYGVMALLH